MMENGKTRGGFEDIPESPAWVGGPRKQCRDPEHNPPMGLHIPAGKQYRHICPSCGREHVIRAHEVMLSGGGFQ